MSSPTARVTLRYRPGADVLSGLIDLGEVGATCTDSPDADTSVVWAQVTDGQTVGDHLVSFHVLFAAARLGEGALPLPAALHPAARSLIAATRDASESVDDPLARLRAKGEAVTEVLIAALARDTLTTLAPLPAPAPRAQAAQLSHSLSRLATAVRTRATVAPADQLARNLDELSSSIRHRHGRTAPGTTAAARAAARDVTTLSAQERSTLEHAMTALDRPERWSLAERSLATLLVALEPPTHTT